MRTELDREALRNFLLSAGGGSSPIRRRLGRAGLRLRRHQNWFYEIDTQAVGRWSVIPGFPKAANEEDEGMRREALLASQEKRPVLSVTTAARLLGKSTDTIYRWLNAGRLSPRKVRGRWLIYRDSVEKQWSAEVVEAEPDDRGTP